jgi:hypothetical protein
VRVEVLGGDRQREVDFDVRPDGLVRSGRVTGGADAGVAAFVDVLEVSVPFASLGLGPGDRVQLAVHVLREAVEVERLPRYGFVALTVPDADFEGVNWRV